VARPRHESGKELVRHSLLVAVWLHALLPIDGDISQPSKPVDCAIAFQPIPYRGSKASLLFVTYLASGFGGPIVIRPSIRDDANRVRAPLSAQYAKTPRTPDAPISPGVIFLLAYRPGARAWAAIKAPGAAVGKLITGVDKLADDSAMAMLDWRG